MTTDQDRRLQTALLDHRAGRLPAAAKAYKRILQKTPDNFVCAYSLAMLYAQQGDLGAATGMFRRAAAIRPDNLEARYNLAVALSMTEHHEEAAQNYRQILENDPRHANARNNYAATLLHNGRAEEALHQYDQLIAFNPNVADAYNNRGMALQNLKRFEEAVRDYDKAIALRPNFPEAHVNRGNALSALQRPDDALASYEKAIALKPDFADAYNNIGNIYRSRGLFKEALAAYDKTLALRSDDSEARSMRLLAKMHLCDWSGLETDRAEIIAGMERGSLVYPFVGLAISASLAAQLRCAKSFATTRFPVSDRPLWRGEVYAHDRIRVAYLSADFREHATARSLLGIFEHHDRSRFEVTGISFGPDRDSPIRQRMKDACERFIDVQGNGDEEIAALVRELETDIAVDLMGYSEGARTAIFARRPAPVQVGYLGYLGTMGTQFVDYLIADKVALPPESQRYFTEKIVHLPDCFLVGDYRLEIAPDRPSRRDVGLPGDGFVFCSFNNSYKFARPTFEAWMRLLGAAEGSVLWLLESNAEMADNLRREAQRCGVDPGRIVFAPRVAFAAHLARQRLADLFLDTAPYNAGATAAAALWAGVPLVTAIGETFVGRMAASMLRAVGLPQLVTVSLADYEALALRIAAEPALSASLKDDLARNRESCPLFDTERFTRHIEAAYTKMRQRYRDGEQPASFAVAAGE